MVDRIAAVLRSRRLQDLAGDQPLEREGLDADGLGPEVGEDLRGAGEEEVAGEDRDRVAPAGVRAGHPAPHGGLVHHVVVIQRGEVGQLHDHGRGHDAGGVGVAELGREHHQQRPEPFAAGPHQVLGGLRDERHLAFGCLKQPFLDSNQSGLDIGFQSLVPHAQPERPDDGHEGSPVCWCLLAITWFVDRSLPPLKSAYPVTFRSPLAPTVTGRSVSDHERYVFDQVI